MLQYFLFQLSITGQAFGVGAFEEDDDDIYARDDMTNYDFNLDAKKKAAKKQVQAQSANIIDGTTNTILILTAKCEIVLNFKM